MVHYRHKKSGQISADMPFLLVLERFSVLCKHFLSRSLSWLLVARIVLVCRVCVWWRICDWRGWYFGRFCGRFSWCFRLVFECSSCGINICHSICVQKLTQNEHRMNAECTFRFLVYYSITDWYYIGCTKSRYTNIPYFSFCGRYYHSFKLALEWGGKCRMIRFIPCLFSRLLAASIVGFNCL